MNASVCRVVRFVPAMILAAACSGGGANAPAPGAGGEGDKEASKAAASDPHAEFGPLEVGADYESYQKMNTEHFLSPTHGKRFVNVYVNDIGADAYRGDGEIPVGTIIVKDSFENDDGTASDIAGPLFVMEKREPGFDSDNGDWWYALHWAEIPENWQKRVGTDKAYWRTPSKKVDYCSDCHNSYDRELGMVPDEHMAAPPAASDATKGDAP